MGRLTATEPRPLHRGWPLYEVPRRFELGSILDCAHDDLADFAVRQALGHNRGGWWDCDLADNRLTWTAGVYDIFGLPQGAEVARDEAVAFYCEDSRAALERLRSYSIARQRGFVLDARIRPAGGAAVRWMRVIAAPVFEDGRAVQLHGLKLWL
jgi:PAS domain-containing protein